MAQTAQSLNGYADLRTAHRMAVKRVAALVRTKADANEIAEAVQNRNALPAAISTPA